MEKCNFLSIVISFVRNISLLTYFIETVLLFSQAEIIFNVSYY